MGKWKGKGKVEVEGSTRERSISWDEEHTKFMLDWFIEYKKDQHAGFVWKSQHHLKCADALNKEFAMGVTFAQVSCHYRHYKENWKIVERALNKSGNGFDATKCKLTISESEKACLKVRDRRLLAKPIKYFHEMQELFSGSNADGSLAIYQQTYMDVDSKSDNSDWEGMNDMASYPHPIDIAAEDSDT
ncbi:uncharacterized protein LOC107304791 [Oryza brachyantha]|uniref:uncharacterized protein LOC107304791 n=1 Tax=Oryza brachyantha TaxID=4533 RepID=UPI001ADAC0EB|nr:uncharacterized protein LOC107304791 [Oryza brachyantha]XP_040382990.1 uncharacterized protein LOC107304791 [Oryza brachyantha]